MVENMIGTPMFGIAVSLLFYVLGVLLQKKTGWAWANPLLTSGVMIIIFLQLAGISFDTYNDGARFITMFLSPATAVLAVNMYKQSAVLRKNLLPILCGTAAGAATSLISVSVMCRIFGLSEGFTLGLLPKTATTAISLPLTQMMGGIDSILVAATMITGISAAVLAPVMVKLYRVKNPVAVGLAMGTCGHGAGTAKALEMGETQGAMSGIAIGMTGLFTVIFCAFIG